MSRVLIYKTVPEEIEAYAVVTTKHGPIDPDLVFCPTKWNAKRLQLSHGGDVWKVKITPLSQVEIEE